MFVTSTKEMAQVQTLTIMIPQCRSIFAGIKGTHDPWMAWRDLASDHCYSYA
jgi:hypothetical protein